METRGILLFGILLSGVVLFAAGCADYQPAATPAASKTQSSQPAPASPVTSGVAPAPQFPIQLSTGVALAQTGPEGTMMTFSVDYQFVDGQQPAPQRYVWVIERAKGDPAKLPVQLKASGDLPAILTSWRPEDGPFQGHLEDTSGNRLSETISLR